MKTLLFVACLKPGMLNAYKKFVAEFTGPRKQEYKELLKRYGLKTGAAWHEKFSDRDYVIIVHEVDNEKDTLERLKTWGSSTHPFDHWFGEHLSKCYEKSPDPAHLLFKFDPSQH